MSASHVNHCARFLGNGVLVGKTIFRVGIGVGGSIVATGVGDEVGTAVGVSAWTSVAGGVPPGTGVADGVPIGMVVAGGDGVADTGRGAVPDTGLATGRGVSSCGSRATTVSVAGGKGANVGNGPTVAVGANTSGAVDAPMTGPAGALSLWRSYAVTVYA